MSNKSVQNKPMTPMVILSALAKAGVAALAVSSGMPAANARPLTVRNDQIYPLPHFTDAADRANCSAALAAATDQNLAKQQFTRRDVKLTGCRVAVPENGTCPDPIGRHNKDGSISLREPHKKHRNASMQDQKTRTNAQTIARVLACNDKKRTEPIAQRIKDQNIRVDNVLLVLEDATSQEICLLPSGRRKAYGAANAAVLLNKETCEVKGMHPMLKTVPCVNLCDEAAHIQHIHTKSPPPPPSTGRKS